MHQDGMAIESHTVHHPNLQMCTDANLAAELSLSRATIATQVGQAPDALAYPGGHYDQRVMAAVGSAGYLMAVTVVPGDVLSPFDRFEWSRMSIGPAETPTDFAQALAGKTPARHVARLKLHRDPSPSR